MFHTIVGPAQFDPPVHFVPLPILNRPAVSQDQPRWICTRISRTWGLKRPRLGPTEIVTAPASSSTRKVVSANTPSRYLSKMTCQEIEALLRLLAEFEREELELLMRERREAEWEGRLH